MTDLITDEIVEAAARSDAAFDGRDFDKLGRADRERYLARCKAALTAALPMLVRAEREANAAIADEWVNLFGNYEITHTSAKTYAADAVKDIATAIRARGKR